MGGNGTNRWNTLRDERIFTSLYVGTVLTTEHLARMYFPSQEYTKNPNTNRPHFSVHAAEVRLHKLRHMGYVLNQSFRPHRGATPVTYWWLTQKRYKREAKAAGRSNESYPDLPKRLSHHFKTHDLYARLHPRMEELFSELDRYEYPDWQWKNEGHSHVRYQYEGKHTVHQPDAEVHFPDGRVFFIERQTEDARKPEEVFRDKAERCRTYIRYRDLPQGAAKIMFVCDIERDKEYVRNACRAVSVPGVVGSPDEMVTYLVQRAEELRENGEGAA